MFAVLQGHEDRVLTASYSTDGRRVVTASEDKTGRVWDTETGKVIAVLQGHEGLVWSASFSRDGRRVATASEDMTARIWDADNGKMIAVLRGHQGEVRSAAFSTDGRRVVTASDDTTARIWDADTGNVIAILQGHEVAGLGGRISSATFSADGRRVVTASWDGTVCLWDANNGKVIAVLHTAFASNIRMTGTHLEPIRWTAKFSPDGRRVLTLPWVEAVIWDAETGKKITALGRDDRSAPARLSSAAFSPDGRRVVTVSSGKTARIWNAETGKMIAVLQRFDGSVHSDGFSADGRRVVTASDNTARVWDLETGKVVASIHAPGVSGASLSADGRHVMTRAGGSVWVGIWRIFAEAQDLIDETKRIIPRCLTRDQRAKAFLDPEPPAWCIEMAKWPYQSQDWKAWLRYKRADANPPLPETSEWSAWIAARRENPSAADDGRK
jgi:WD40 repeat protein